MPALANRLIYVVLTLACVGSPPALGATWAPPWHGGVGLTGAGCLVIAAKDLSDFTASPHSVLEQFPEGGLVLANRVRLLAGASADTLPALLELAVIANSQQKSAIGAGLARAVDACKTINQPYSATIQNAVASLTDGDVLTAFATTLNDLRVADIAGTTTTGTAGSAFALFDQSRIDGAQNNFSIGGDEGTATQPFIFSVGRAGQFTATTVSPTTP